LFIIVKRISNMQHIEFKISIISHSNCECVFSYFTAMDDLKMRTVLFWVVKQRVVIISYGRVLKLGQIGCPKTSVRNCHNSFRNHSEERSSHLFRGGILKSCVA